MNFAEKIRAEYLKEGDNSLDGKSESSKIIALYLYYHYFNADTTKLSDITYLLINKYNDVSFKIKAIVPSCTTENVLDFIIYVGESDYCISTPQQLADKIKKSAYEIGQLKYHEEKFINTSEQEKFDDANFELKDNSLFCLNVVCPYYEDAETKIELQQLVSEIKLKNNNVIFNLLYADDLEEEVNDIENPKECVPRGNIDLMTDGICKFGYENSFISLVSAKSLKQLFYRYSTRGLFASNLRFYVTSKKIDGKIINTIQNESDEFCYLNNGIVITCDDYNIINNQLILTNFSIVNGGQTTNLIGRTPFENDFGVICKVIKSRYDNEDDNIQFLSKVAEASNTQKPIKAKDLIANMIEQRKLKIQFADAGMFLKVKRGEKIDKQLYPKPYMNATNEEVAQMLYSCVYQSPGYAKCSCSSLLSIEKYYNLIFKNEYDSNFLKSLQFFKVAYSDWKKEVAKKEPKITLRYGLSKHMNFYILAMIGYIMKIAVNSNLYDKVKNLSTKDINSKNDDFKKLLRCNDIGKITLIKENLFDVLTKKSLFNIINFLIDEVAAKAYTLFKKSYPNYAYGQFAKSDKYYYDFVLPVLNSIIFKKNALVVNKTKDYLNIEGVSNVDVEENVEIEENGETFKDDLLNYRRKIREENPDLKLESILKTTQIMMIMKYYPITKERLKNTVFLNDDQIRNYGNDIINIVKKYRKLEDFS